MRRAVATILLVLSGLLMSGCSGDDSGGDALAQSPAPEQITTDAATVATGLGQITDIAAQIETSISDSPKATDLDGQIEPIWSTIEGTVKGNDPDAYISLEDAFAVLEEAAANTDATKAASGSTAVSETVTAYLNKYPGS